MTLDITDDERDLRDSVRRWAGRHVTAQARRAAVEAPRQSRPEYWDSLAELGMLGLHLPEEVGGAGYTLLEAAVVAEELGRSMAPGAYLPSTIVSAALLEAGRTDRLGDFARGTRAGGVAVLAGSLVISRTGQGLVLTGTSSPVMGGQVADVLLLAARMDDTLTFVAVDRDRVSVTDLDSHDLIRRNAMVTAEALLLDESEVLDLDPQRVLDIAATLFAAEAAGLAGWATATAADYARVRQQFGRVIGQFQGVKHTVARMLCGTERAVVTAWDAARASAEPGAEASLAAAIAAATAPTDAFEVTKTCIQVLGGIGYTWEHDAHLYLRRAQSLRIMLGSSTSWHLRVADLTLAGTRRNLVLDLPAAAERMRAEIRAELAECAAVAESEQRRALAARGYTAPHLEAPWGKAASPSTQVVIGQELRAAGLRPHNMVIGNWVVPTLLAHGTPEQIQRWVPDSLSGEVIWCQLFSEPGAGSDLAALNTKAVRVDGGWTLHGQKVWTSKAHVADWGVCLARTDAGAGKHGGLSYFIVDMKNTPGLDIRPLREITGSEHFNEVFLDAAFVPDESLIGGEGDGWKIARTTLANERVMFTEGSAIGAGAQALLSIAQGSPEPLSEHDRGRLGEILCADQAGALMGLRAAMRSVAGAQPGTESSITKLLSVETLQRVWELAMEWGGPNSLVALPDEHLSAYRFLNVQCMSIAGGTTNVQLNIIGERILGLPRDPEPTTTPAGKG